MTLYSSSVFSFLEKLSLQNLTDYINREYLHMIITHNISTLNTVNQLTQNNKKKASTMEK